MFRIKEGKGFSIKFANGYTISVQFGPANYCDNHDRELIEKTLCGQEGCKNAECAVLDAERSLITLPLRDDTVTAYSNPAEVLELMNWAASLPTKTADTND